MTVFLSYPQSHGYKLIKLNVHVTEESLIFHVRINSLGVVVVVGLLLLLLLLLLLFFAFVNTRKVQLI